MKVHILERILFVVIAGTLIFTGLYLYTYLVSIYQSHWPHVLASYLGNGTWPTTSYIPHARWTPIESQELDRGQPAAFQSDPSFVLPAGASGDLEASRYLLSLQDGHASDVLYFNQSISASAAAAAAVNIEVKFDAFYESEALQADTRGMCALRPSRGQYDMGVFATVPRHQCSARDDIILRITVWLPEHRAAEAHVPQPQLVIGDSPPRASAFGGQLSTPLMNAPIELDTVGLPFLVFYTIPVIIGGKAQINTPHRHVCGKCNDVLELATAAGPNIAAGITTHINNNDLRSSIILTITDASQIIRRICPADSRRDGFFCASAHSPNSPFTRS